MLNCYYGGIQRSYNGSYSNVTGMSALADGDVEQLAIDYDAQKCWVGKNNVWVDASNTVTGDPAAGTDATFTSSDFPTNMSLFVSAYYGFANLNCGQRPFAYTPPTDYKALNTYNLDAPDFKPSTVFNTVTYTGSSSPQTVSGLNFESGLIWIKSRSHGAWHILQDSVRGFGKSLFSNDANDEVGNANDLISNVSATGFSVNTTYNGGTDTSTTTTSGTNNYVAWAWNAGTTTDTNNTAGSITPTGVRANTSAGFSIAKYTSPNNSSDQSFGHGLGVKPDLVIVKNLDSSYSWDIYHSSLGYNASLIFTDATTRSGAFSAEPTPTVVNTKHDYTHYSTNNYIAYCWTSVESYSKFGSYEGNNSADGPFVHLGFQPALIIVKNIDTTSTNWEMWDSKRPGYNLTNLELRPNQNNDEFESSANCIDILSNGFKLRGTDSQSNSAATFVYAAWAETPFKYSNAR